MIYYHSHLAACKGMEEVFPRPVGVLCNFFDERSQKRLPYMDPFFLDSGAFGAWSRGTPIDLDDYSEFLKQNMGEYDEYAALDVIGDGPASWENYLRMVDHHGLDPIPAFHYGEPVELLEKYLDRTDHIAFGALVGKNAKQIDDWCDWAWDHIYRIRPDTKVHAFGVNRLQTLMRFPWYSADASSIRRAGQFGSIFTPWGVFRINPDVATGCAWMKGSPGIYKQVREWVESLGCPFTFEEAQIQDNVGTLRRCAISLHHYDALSKRITEAHQTIKREPRRKAQGFGLL